MNALQMIIDEHIKIVDQFLNFECFTGSTLSAWVSPLINCMTEDGAVPYLLDGQKERYRASPLSSIITYLNNAGLLPDKAIDIMQNKLIFLRDQCEVNDDGNIRKLDEDVDGWSMAEGVSVWSTSLAIVAMLDNRGIGQKKAQEYKKSVMWLARQQEPGKKGWGYQLSINCTENVIMTALALRALAKALKNKKYFLFNEEEERLIITALSNGFIYLKDNIRYSKRKELT